ncbi:unnamed protein product [Amoebophrya sp. A25]|nr:unnamed protein product [Amoebophrya sp. A25]|eukprot:GSA25T00011282001.1
MNDYCGQNYYHARQHDSPDPQPVRRRKQQAEQPSEWIDEAAAGGDEEVPMDVEFPGADQDTNDNSFNWKFQDEDPRGSSTVPSKQWRAPKPRGAQFIAARGVLPPPVGAKPNVGAVTSSKSSNSCLENLEYREGDDDGQEPAEQAHSSTSGKNNMSKRGRSKDNFHGAANPNDKDNIKKGEATGSGWSAGDKDKGRGKSGKKGGQPFTALPQWVQNGLFPGHEKLPPPRPELLKQLPAPRGPRCDPRYSLWHEGAARVRRQVLEDFEKSEIPLPQRVPEQVEIPRRNHGLEDRDTASSSSMRYHLPAVASSSGSSKNVAGSPTCAPLQQPAHHFGNDVRYHTNISNPVSTHGATTSTGNANTSSSTANNTGAGNKYPNVKKLTKIKETARMKVAMLGGPSATTAVNYAALSGPSASSRATTTNEATTSSAAPGHPGGTRSLEDELQHAQTQKEHWAQKLADLSAAATAHASQMSESKLIAAKQVKRDARTLDDVNAMLAEEGKDPLLVERPIVQPGAKGGVFNINLLDTVMQLPVPPAPPDPAILAMMSKMNKMPQPPPPVAALPGAPAFNSLLGYHPQGSPRIEAKHPVAVDAGNATHLPRLRKIPIPEPGAPCPPSHFPVPVMPTNLPPRTSTANAAANNSVVGGPSSSSRGSVSPLFTAAAAVPSSSFSSVAIVGGGGPKGKAFAGPPQLVKVSRSTGTAQSMATQHQNHTTMTTGGGFSSSTTSSSAPSPQAPQVVYEHEHAVESNTNSSCSSAAASSEEQIADNGAHPAVVRSELVRQKKAEMKPIAKKEEYDQWVAQRPTFIPDELIVRLMRDFYTTKCQPDHDADERSKHCATFLREHPALCWYFDRAQYLIDPEAEGRTTQLFWQTLATGKRNMRTFCSHNLIDMEAGYQSDKPTAYQLKWGPRRAYNLLAQEREAAAAAKKIAGPNAKNKGKHAKSNQAQNKNVTKKKAAMKSKNKKNQNNNMKQNNSGQGQHGPTLTHLQPFSRQKAGLGDFNASDGPSGITMPQQPHHHPGSLYDPTGMMQQQASTSVDVVDDDASSSDDDGEEDYNDAENDIIDFANNPFA